MFKKTQVSSLPQNDVERPHVVIGVSPYGARRARPAIEFREDPCVPEHYFSVSPGDIADDWRNEYVKRGYLQTFGRPQPPYCDGGLPAHGLCYPEGCRADFIGWMESKYPGMCEGSFRAYARDLTGT